MSLRTILLLTGSFIFSYAESQVKITLRKSFVDSLKNKITIKSDFGIYFAHASANAAKDDGDLHVAGYDPIIGLPSVAELMNAKNETAALQFIHANEGSGVPASTVVMRGTWRLWAEHISSGAHYQQGMGDGSIHNTNPDHVFEIHPITKLGTQDMLPTLRRVVGFKPYLGRKAFRHYLNIMCNLFSTTNTFTIQTKKAKFNYADFWIKINSAFVDVSDGLFVDCNVLHSTFKPGISNEANMTITTGIRMVFVEGSVPFDTVRTLSVGDFLHVIGIPRINLKVIDQRVDDGVDLAGKMPVEMIIVGIR